MTLNQKTVVVTGAGRGLGAAFALSLAPLGCELILCARREEDLARIAAGVVDHGGKTPRTIQLDLSDAASVRAAADSIASMTGHVDVLINNGAMWLDILRRGGQDQFALAGSHCKFPTSVDSVITTFAGETKSRCQMMSESKAVAKPAAKKWLNRTSPISTFVSLHQEASPN